MTAPLRSRLFLTTLVALAALGLCGCPGDPPAVGCANADDCLVGQVCTGGKCVSAPADAAASGPVDSGAPATCDPTCAEDEQCLGTTCFKKLCDTVACREGEVCRDGWCVEAACASVTCDSGQVCQGGECVSSTCEGVVCGQGMGCKGGVCVDELCVKVDCQGGQVCAGGRCVETSCSSGACAESEVCWDGTCVDPRCVNASCPEGTVCEAGNCSPVSYDAGTPRRDAGSSPKADASTTKLDAGPATKPDAGSPASPDGSVISGPDAGAPAADAGPACGAYCAPFSVVLLPDTQYYTSKQTAGAANTYYKQAQWIIDHWTSNNIQFVIHLGDITNDNETEQWKVADGAHLKLDNAAIPYSMVPGNHDYRSTTGDEWSRSNSQFNDYFGPTRFSGKPFYGGHYSSGNDNNYTLFEVGPMKFMVISLEYAPRKEPLCWAENVIKAHPDRRVIIASHCIQTNGGGFSANCPNVDYLVPGGNGQTIWDELARRHKNVFLMVSGHIHDSEHKFATALTGQTITKVLTDYQMEAACTLSSAASCTNHCQAGVYTGNGWMRELVFKPLENRVYARTFTVESGNKNVFPGGTPALFCGAYNKTPSSVDHQFDFPYDLSGTVSDVRNDGGLLAFTDMTANSIGAGDQLNPVLGMTSAGGFVMAWEDDSSTADGSGNHDIMIRGFSPGGCQSFAQTTANANTSGQQRLPSLGVAGDGRFALAWEDDNDANGTFQIYARGFKADGTENVPTLTVNTTAAGQQRNPALAMATDGRFVVAYEDDQDGDGKFQIRVRGFSATGAQSFADRSAHDDALGVRAKPSVAMAADGTFVVAWEDDTDGNGIYQIHARGFAANGTPRWAAKAVNSVSTGQQRKPAVACDTLGNFVVAWQDDQDDDGKYNILARGFTAAGAQRIADFPAHKTLGGQHLSPSVAVAPDGSFVIGWQDDADANGTYQIRARGFSAAGAEKKAEFTINRFASGQQRMPVVGFAARGKLVAAWEDDMDGNGSYQILAGGDDLAGF
ncbi:MAG: metallophosphoesterase [Myxococcales bacterium]